MDTSLPGLQGAEALLTFTPPASEYPPGCMRLALPRLRQSHGQVLALPWTAVSTPALDNRRSKKEACQTNRLAKEK
jgi:hypothetical protein